jgi:hypothetical protein
MSDGKFEIVELGVASEVTKTGGPGFSPDEFAIPSYWVVN